MCAVTCRSVMNAITRKASPQRGHWVTWSPKTLRNRAAQSSLRASIIGVGGGVIGLAGSGAAGSAGTTRERQLCAEDRTPETGPSASRFALEMPIRFCLPDREAKACGVAADRHDDCGLLAAA